MTCLEGSISPAQVLDANDPNAEGLYIGEELHAETCSCQPCATENARVARVIEETEVEPWEQWRERIQGLKREWHQRITARENDEAWAVLNEANAKAEQAGIHVPNAFEANEALWEAIDRAELDAIAIESFKHTRPLVAGDAAKIPAVLARSDGATILYEGRLNSLFGEPALGKSWVALITLVEAVKSGARAVWWDFEDQPSTLGGRLTALGAADLLDSDSLIYATPTLADDPDEIAAMCAWMVRGKRPGFVVIDSVESAGLATDSNNAGPWFRQHVDPWLESGAGVLTLDHIPKRTQDRPRGAIGSQHKMARISGAGLLLTGTPWTKTQGGKVKLINHKDRQGDLPEPLNKTVAIIEVTHGDDGQLLYTITAPNVEENTEDVTGLLLEAIAATGSQGVRTMKGIRGLLTAGHMKVDPALHDLLNQGLVEIGKDGKANIYVATPAGHTMLEMDQET